MNIFNTIILDPIFNFLVVCYNVTGDLGLAIIALTLIVRVMLLPLANKAMRSQRRLQVLAPDLKKIQDKHKDDREVLAKELMKFYKQEKVSPASSCLPLLLQVPILIALFFVFKDAAAGIHLDHLYSFVHRPSSIDPNFLGILDLSKPDRFVLPALTAGLQFWQSKMLLPKDASGPAAMSKQLVYIFPILTFVIATTLPAALPLYWATSTLFTLIQQYVIIKEMPLAEARAEGIADWNKANPKDQISKSKKIKGAKVTVRKRQK